MRTTETLATPGGPEQPAARDIDTITGEILDAKRAGGEAILTIGQRLAEAKAMLDHGEWLPWLTERVEFSERSAQNFMRLARKWSNPQTLADLGASKALTLLALPEEERDEFISSVHVVDGEEKTAAEMSARELAQAIRDRDAARLDAEKAAADQRAAELARDEIARQMQVVNESLAESSRQLEQTRKELDELRARPVEVAVEQVADPETVKKAQDEARAEMQTKLDKAKAAKEKAEKQKKELAEELAAANAKLDALAKEEKKAAISSDKDLAAFEILFGQAQDVINKLHGLMLKFQSREDPSSAAGVRRALLALADKVKGAAE